MGLILTCKCFLDTSRSLSDYRTNVGVVLILDNIGPSSLFRQLGLTEYHKAGRAGAFSRNIQTVHILTLQAIYWPEGKAGDSVRTSDKRKTSYWKKRIETGQLSLIDGLRSLKWRAVALEPDSSSLLNVNSPEDMDRLRRLPP